MQLPSDVLAFLEEMRLVRDPDLRINPLAPEQSASWSARLQGSGVAADLGLFVLDDANDSNPYCFISKGPAAGMVVHLSHDQEPAIAFPSLASFGAALRTAVDEHIFIDDLPRPPLAPHPDQEGLAEFLRSELASGDQDAPFHVCLHLPLLDPARIDNLERAAAHADYFVREAAAHFLVQHPLPEHLPIAERLADDPIPQVARPARLAKSRANDLRQRS